MILSIDLYYQYIIIIDIIISILGMYELLSNECCIKRIRFSSYLLSNFN